MAEQKSTQHIFKKDKYVNARGGNSCFLDLYCSACRQHLALYQKDGHGSLIRLYLDRIFDPRELSELQSKSIGKKNMPNLRCPKCGSLIGTPMVYEREQRLAFRLIRGSFVKEKSSGNYPPSNQNSQNVERGDVNENEYQTTQRR